MKYIAICKKDEIQFSNEFDNLSEAKWFLTLCWKGTLVNDRKCISDCYIIESQNPNEESHDHFNGNILFAIKKDGRMMPATLITMDRINEKCFEPVNANKHIEWPITESYNLDDFMNDLYDYLELNHQPNIDYLTSHLGRFYSLVYSDAAETDTLPSVDITQLFDKFKIPYLYKEK